MIFLDTSAVLALADLRDEHHAEAVAALESLMSAGNTLLSHNYVLEVRTKTPSARSN